MVWTLDRCGGVDSLDCVERCGTGGTVWQLAEPRGNRWMR